MHSWHIAFQDLFQSFESYSFKEYCFQRPFFPKFLETKKVSERKYFKGVPLVWSYFIFPLVIFENQYWEVIKLNFLVIGLYI
jgi:hypothetical protein